MPKRSLHPGSGDQKKIEQLNQAVEKMLARNDGRVTKAGAEIEPLVRIAADLRNLPSASFKARLKSELGGKKRMSTVAEPVATAPHDLHAPRLHSEMPPKRLSSTKRLWGERNIPLRGWRHRSRTPRSRLETSRIMLAGEWPEGGRFSAETLGNSPVWLVVEVADVDAFCRARRSRRA